LNANINANNPFYAGNNNQRFPLPNISGNNTSYHYARNMLKTSHVKRAEAPPVNIHSNMNQAEKMNPSFAGTSTTS
jgi:hypothetical protein